MREIYIGCACREPSHTVILRKDDDFDEVGRTVWFEWQLASFQPFWTRVKQAFAYVFTGRDTITWDTVELDAHAVVRIREFLKDTVAP